MTDSNETQQLRRLASCNQKFH